MKPLARKIAIHSLPVSPGGVLLGVVQDQDRFGEITLTVGDRLLFPRPLATPGVGTS